jgi:hypothetical protein
MTTPVHGGLVERSLESVGMWLRLAAAAVRTATLAEERGRPLVEAELHEAAAYRYEEAERQAERVAEGCRIQAEYHRRMAEICRGESEERT